MSAGTSVAARGPSRVPPYHPQGGATRSVGHLGKVFGAAASEAYVPRMIDREYALEDDPSSFLELG